MHKPLTKNSRLLAGASFTLTVLVSPAQAQCEVWSQSAPDPSPWQSYGFAVELSAERLVVSRSTSGSGHVEVYDRYGEALHHVATLSPSDPLEVDEFGFSVATDADTMVVGTTDSGLLSTKGAAYVFDRQPDGSWIEGVKLEPPHVDAWAFGWDVDIEGDRLVVGAKGASSLGGGKGMAFVFEREAGTWVHKATIQPSIAIGGDGFGNSLDLEGERLVVGASHAWGGSGKDGGMAFVFERHPSGTAWNETGVLDSADLVTYSEFGRDVALLQDRILVGAPNHLNFGAVYVFDLIAGTWTQTAKLEPSDPMFLAAFGWSVDYDGTTAIIGAMRSDGYADTAGAAYVFKNQSGTWTELTKVVSSDLVEGDAFGYSVDLEGSEFVVGAPANAGGAIAPGSARLYALSSGGPSLIGQGTEVSVSAGGTQSLHLGACPSHAGDLFVVAGSATGAIPGFVFAGLPVPLNPDAYFLHTVNHVGAAPLVDGLGILDADGRAVASFTLPPSSEPTLAGLELHHAYAVLDGITWQFQDVSNAVPVSLEP